MKLQKPTFLFEQIFPEKILESLIRGAAADYEVWLTVYDSGTNKDLQTAFSWLHKACTIGVLIQGNFSSWFDLQVPWRTKDLSYVENNVTKSCQVSNLDFH